VCERERERERESERESVLYITYYMGAMLIMTVLSLLSG